MADAGAGRDDPEPVECLLGPAQELIALDVALVLDVHVLVEGLRLPRHLGDDRMVDHQLHRHQRVDLGRVAAQRRQRVAHGGQVDHPGHAGEVLHEDALGGQSDLRGVLTAQSVPVGMRPPSGHGLDVGGPDRQPVFVAQQVLQDHLDRIGQAAHVEAVGQGIDPVDLVGGVADSQAAAGSERVGSDGGGRGLCHGPILSLGAGDGEPGPGPRLGVSQGRVGRVGRMHRARPEWTGWAGCTGRDRSGPGRAARRTEAGRVRSGCGSGGRPGE